MALLYDCSDPTKRTRGMGVAARAIKAGRLVVLPTDTVYGVGADAFSPEAIHKLLDAKGRGPDMPVPVLVGSADAWTGVALTNEASEALAAVFWPGGLSLLCHEQPSLDWNLGDTGGTVVVRMPQQDVALELLRKTGPMGVSSANLSGQPPARSAQEAREQLGDAIAVYLEAGMTAADVPSTIVDVTGEIPRVVRAGAISLERLREVVPEIIGPEESAPGESSAEESPTEESSAEGTSAATAEPIGRAAEGAEAADESGTAPEEPEVDDDSGAEPEAVIEPASEEEPVSEGEPASEGESKPQEDEAGPARFDGTRAPGPDDPPDDDAEK